MSSSFESHGSQNQLPRNLDSSSASQLSEKGKDVLAVNSSIELSSAAKAVVESDIRKSGTPRFSDSNLEGKVGSSSNAAETVAYFNSGLDLIEWRCTLHAVAKLCYFTNSYVCCHPLSNCKW